MLRVHGRRVGWVHVRFEHGWFTRGVLGCVETLHGRVEKGVFVVLDRGDVRCDSVSRGWVTAD